MSLIRRIEGLISKANALGTTRPLFIGGEDCNGLLQPLPICETNPTETSKAVFVTPRPVKVFRDSFSNVISDSINSQWDIISIGAGQTINQAGGNLVLTSGATPNEEIIIRTKLSWEDAFVLRYLLTNSAYQANAKTTVEMVDVIGDDLPITSSTTAISITKNNHGFTSANIGQSVFIGAFKNIVGGTPIPGQWAIASITNVNTFVVTATGSTGTITSGTCSVWGYNSIRTQYGATSTTTAYINSTRKGWNSAGDTSVTTSTITSGSMGMWSVQDGLCLYSNTTINSAGTFSSRGARTSGTPGSDAELFLQIRLTVGTSAPTAITTTIGMVSIEDTASMPVELVNNRGMQTGANAIGVNVVTAPTTNITITAPSTSANGVTTFGLINSANTTNTTSQKGSAGAITSIELFNNGAAPAYFKLYNKASAPALATDTPILILGIGAGQAREISFTHHLRLGTGIAYAITGGAANTDTTVVAANQVTGGIQYA